MKAFRPYQTQARDAIISNWTKFRSGICVMATGGGKTLVAAGTAARVLDRGRVLFLANRNELCQQPLEAFYDQCGIIPALEKADDFAPLHSRIVVGSVQTLARSKRLERFPRDHFSFIFADECHYAVSPTWRRILDYFGGAKLCGITATPFRSDSKSLTDVFQAEFYRKDLFSLVDDGFLVDPDHVDRLDTAISLADVRVKKSVEGEDYDLQDADDAIRPYFKEIARELATKFPERHILAFLPLVASSQKFVEECVLAGINAVHIDGEDPDRKEKLERFKRGQITLLSNSALLHTGVDMPICDATLNLRPTKSKVLYCQIVGRSTRTAPGTLEGAVSAQERLEAIARSSKPRAYIIDPLWLSEDHDLCTPSFLIAPDQEYAVQMNKAASKSYSLRDLREQIQREREEVILRRLQSVSRFREGRVSTEEFAAATHELGLLTYEPVYKWEARPITPFTKLLLKKAGIDPETVTGEGHGRAVMEAIGRRRNRGRLEIPDLADYAEKGVENLWILTNP